MFILARVEWKPMTVFTETEYGTRLLLVSTWGRVWEQFFSLLGVHIHSYSESTLLSESCHLMGWITVRVTIPYSVGSWKTWCH